MLSIWKLRLNQVSSVLKVPVTHDPIQFFSDPKA